MVTIGMSVNPDGSVDVIEAPTEALREAMGPIADRLREVVELSKAVADEYRQSDPAGARNAALVRSHAETALLYALFGDRV